MPDMDFRSLTVEDVPEMHHLERLSFSRPTSKEAYVNEMLNNDHAHYYGLFIGEQLIAFGGYWLIIDEGHVINIAVHPAFRRQGYGELLMRRVIVACMSQGGQRMTLEVRKHNTPAQYLYQKLGFVKDGVHPGYYDDPKDDAVIMWLDMLHQPAAGEAKEQLSGK